MIQYINMESLPKQFVLAMRTLFDIMDDKRTGYIKLCDIENRWRDDRIRGLPQGVIESLQKVASHDGLLTFERFCTGLKICLLRNQVDGASNTKNIRSENLDHPPPRNPPPASHSQRTPPNPVSDKNKERKWEDLNLTDKLSRHSLSPLTTSNDDNDISENKVSISNVLKYDVLFAPPKPPRLERPISLERKDVSSSAIMISDKDASSDIDCRGDMRAPQQQGRGHGDGRPDAVSAPGQRRVSRRREPRRHTLHNGIDYNLLKRMKQIELEKEILLQGLSAVEDAREWYLKQLAEVQEKMRFAGRLGAYVEPWNEGQQERLELLRARVSELNRQLGALAAAGWRQRRGPLSLHMNLALPHNPLADFSNIQPNRASMLTTQNKMLLEEVNRKNDLISNLECEKSALIRELLSQRNQKKSIDSY